MNGSSPALTPTQDLAANVSLGTADNAAAAAAASRLVCPICNEEMVRSCFTYIRSVGMARANESMNQVTLLQLNRCVDSLHMVA